MNEKLKHCSQHRSLSSHCDKSSAAFTITRTPSQDANDTFRIYWTQHVLLHLILPDEDVLRLSGKICGLSFDENCPLTSMRTKHQIPQLALNIWRRSFLADGAPPHLAQSTDDLLH